MRATVRNRHQKAAHRPGERRVSRAEVARLIGLAASEDEEDRLTAAKNLCPCHVRGRTEAIWDAVTQLMTDPAPKVRFAAWHTLEDGGIPPEPGVFERLAALFDAETDASVRRVAEEALGPALAGRERLELGWMRRSAAPRVVGKCDFCGARDVAVERDLETMIPTAGLSRPALLCGACAKPI